MTSLEQEEMRVDLFFSTNKEIHTMTIRDIYKLGYDAGYGSGYVDGINLMQESIDYEKGKER